MRFVSDKRGLSINIVAGYPEITDPTTGRVTRAAVPDLEAKFSHDLLDEEATRVAMLPRSQNGLANTDRRADGSMPDSPFRGATQDESGKFLDFRVRFSVFDSEIAQLQNGWTDEQRELVEKKLLEHSFRGSLYQVVEALPAERPWSGYDSVSDPAQILMVAEATQSDLATILRYEKENQNRPDVVDALDAAVKEQDETDVIVTA